MDRSRGETGKQSRPQPPSSSRLTVKPRTARANRRRPGSVWSRLPKPVAIADACGRALRRSVPLVAGAGVLVAVGGTAWAGYRFVTTSPRFAITTLEVRGNQQLSTEHVLAQVPVRIGDNVFQADLETVTAELRKNRWVASATTRRQLPHTLVVEIREHVPAAIVELGGLYLVDADGQPFKRAELGASDDGAGLPIITGLDRTSYLTDSAGTSARVKHALAALGHWREEPDRPSIGEVHLGTHGALTLVTYEHAISIQLGLLDDDLPSRMQTFDATWAQLSPGERARAHAIHLDARPDQVTVALAPETKRTGVSGRDGDT
jgi:cell division protein FtsQ